MLLNIRNAIGIAISLRYSPIGILPRYNVIYVVITMIPKETYRLFIITAVIIRIKDNITLKSGFHLFIPEK